MVAYYNRHGIRGKWLEDVITNTNRMYAHRNIALINKIPTPTKVIRKGDDLIGAKYTEKSTVDFTGLTEHGQFIAFDTKECQKTAFSFAAVKSHQIEYLKKVSLLNGIAFLLIYFRNVDEMYRIDIDEFVELMETLNRKSIPYAYFKDNKKPIVKFKYGYFFDYLDAGRKNMEAVK
ncbi:Holliday junction resolvase RecU [Macrococcus capreoli]|uniref:Holliday junction resolvase RecU n=1 Tax=Macrococcus capreoli TaxID=2982690 RepID=UPI0021D57AE1|nr:Holliday junction resolvase RecU [Macrococcus sp. TMW 2.2395]MCU7557277.1 Holliday junction resolvase RecU [Macrococcus sp. TMW 2.2395]